MRNVLAVYRRSESLLDFCLTAHWWFPAKILLTFGKKPNKNYIQDLMENRCEFLATSFIDHGFNRPSPEMLTFALREKLYLLAINLLKRAISTPNVYADFVAGLETGYVKSDALDEAYPGVVYQRLLTQNYAPSQEDFLKLLEIHPVLASHVVEDYPHLVRNNVAACRHAINVGEYNIAVGLMDACDGSKEFIWTDLMIISNLIWQAPDSRALDDLIYLRASIIGSMFEKYLDGPKP